MVFINAHYFRTREIEFEITRTNKYTHIQIYTHTHTQAISIGQREGVYLRIYHRIRIKVNTYYQYLLHIYLQL